MKGSTVFRKCAHSSGRASQRAREVKRWGGSKAVKTERWKMNEYFGVEGWGQRCRRRRGSLKQNN